MEDRFELIILQPFVTISGYIFNMSSIYLLIYIIEVKCKYYLRELLWLGNGFLLRNNKYDYKLWFADHWKSNNGTIRERNFLQEMHRRKCIKNALRKYKEMHCKLWVFWTIIRVYFDSQQCICYFYTVTCIVVENN